MQASILLQNVFYTSLSTVTFAMC